MRAATSESRIPSIGEPRPGGVRRYRCRELGSAWRAVLLLRSVGRPVRVRTDRRDKVVRRAHLRVGVPGLRGQAHIAHPEAGRLAPARPGQLGQTLRLVAERW
jgi:hypothetical protein